MKSRTGARASATDRLRALRDWASVAQVGLATAAVAAGGGVWTPTLLLASAMALLAMLRPLPAVPSPRAQRLWTLGVFAALVATLARALLRAEFLEAGVDFLLLLVVQRLFNRQRAREHMQLLLLGALMMIVGAAINVELSYPLIFAVYVLTAVGALILNTLMAEGERLGPRFLLALSRQSLAHIRTLARAALGVASIAGVGAVLVFLLFPRWGVGAFLRGAMATETRSGFSNEVQLGGFGTIKKDATVVMRIRPHSPTMLPAEVDWHLRGSAFDTYDAGRWSTGRLGESASMMRMWGFWSLAPDNRPLVIRGGPGATAPVVPKPRPGATEADAVLHATVTLEDIGADVLFAASEPLAVELTPRGPVESRAKVRPGRNREFRVAKLPGPVQYQFVSRTNMPSEAQLQAQANPATPSALEAYLQRSDGLSGRVTGLARRLTARAPARIDKVRAVMAHLSAFRYTLQQPQTETVRAGADPIEGFLFEAQAGHCEYFATAMAVLLREVGVPTRIVNGYYGAHYNAIGGYYAVRQADAHSWVEVHFGALGWLTFDPTPPDGREAGRDAPFWPAAAELLDAARNKYLQWVVGFDLSTQRSLLDGLGIRRGSDRFRIAWGPVLAWTLGAIGSVVLLLRLGRWRGAPTVTAEQEQWRRVLVALRRHGLVPTPAESPTAFSQRIARGGWWFSEALCRTAERYEAIRFGPPGSPGRRATLARLLRETTLAIRRRP